MRAGRLQAHVRNPPLRNLELRPANPGHVDLIPIVLQVAADRNTDGLNRHAPGGQLRIGLHQPLHLAHHEGDDRGDPLAWHAVHRHRPMRAECHDVQPHLAALNEFDEDGGLTPCKSLGDGVADSLLH